MLVNLELKCRYIVHTLVISVIPLRKIRRSPRSVTGYFLSIIYKNGFKKSQKYLELELKKFEPEPEVSEHREQD